MLAEGAGAIKTIPIPFPQANHFAAIANNQ
jgi:hypothetical protein